MTSLRILVVGQGAREHALAWRMQRRAWDGPVVHDVVVAPGNAGMRLIDNLRCDPANDVDGWVRLAQRERVDFVVVGPEGPLTGGLVDALAAAGIAVVGPSQAAAALEGSKAFMKDVCRGARVATASFVVVRDSHAAIDFIQARAGRVVIKADGLCAGKGVVVCDDVDMALTTLRAFLGEDGVAPLYGTASTTVVVEERLSGPELSVFALCDGHRAVVLGAARDHKRLRDNDEGPNTGGMGAVFPVPDVDLEHVQRSLLTPVLNEMRDRGVPFRGVLFAGLMLTPHGPSILEFNVRLGDPECEAMMMSMEGDIAALFAAAAKDALHTVPPITDVKPAACVVLAAPGYPESPRGGAAIVGNLQPQGRAHMFAAGVASVDGAQLTASGGRVLCVAAAANTHQDALQAAYAAVAQVSFEGMQFRRDIGASLR
jgi:phosphoribosylamine---glycine ligase